MSEIIASSEKIAVIGTGLTGISVAKFLQRRNKQFMFYDTRLNPPNREVVLRNFPGVACEYGALKVDSLSLASQIVLSPGVDVKDPAIHAAIDSGVEVTGDIQLFADEVEEPIIAITGSNGKSTVTTLVGELMRQAGNNVAVAGNIGTPVLDLLQTAEKVDGFVLELSSFQLETTHALNAEVAVILNVSADHMDRYDSLRDYHAAKQRIFIGAKKIIVNRQDPLTQPLLAQGQQVISFGLDRPDLNQFGVIEDEGEVFLAFGLQKLLPAAQLKLRGRHNIGNALAALAIGHAMNLPMESMVRTLAQFTGLRHRCQWVANIGGVDFVNDSKGTNVGATLAAINGLAANKNIVLIAGGDGKGASFDELAPALQEHVKAVVAIGQDGRRFMDLAAGVNVSANLCRSLQEAVVCAQRYAVSGDVVLLSPACASFDMFKNYEDRGDQFCQAVEDLSV